MRQDVDLVRSTGTAPRVNLLPAAVVERRLVRRQRAGFAVGFVLVLGLLAVLYVGEAGRADRARQAAGREQAATAGLEAHKAGLQPYADLQAEVAGVEQLQASVYAKELRFSGVLQDVSTLIPDNAWLNQMSVNLKDATGTGGAAQAAAATPNGAAATAIPGAPGSGSPVASITLSGTALGHVDVGALIRTLNGTVKRNRQPVYLNPFFTTSQRQAESGQQRTVSFAATVDIGQAAYSGRFQRPGQAGGR
jgi:Tfp pilus assembly protein PilN